MKAWNHILLIFARGGMELSWRYAWALFISLLAAHLTFPLPAAVLAMIMGAIISRMSIASNWRNYQKICLQSALFILLTLVILYWIRSIGTPFWDLYWLHDLFFKTQTLPHWIMLLVLCFFSWLFWQGGRLLIKAPHDYMPICMQFDKGLSLFILLLVVYALVDVRTELNLQNQGLRFTILAFFTFSLASIALSRHHTPGQRSFITGYHGIGVILSALTMLTLFATGTTLLAYPYLFHQADALLVILRDTAQPLTPILIKILIFLFRPRHLKLQGDVQDENIPTIEALGAPVVEGWLAILFSILGAGLIVLICLVILLAMGFLIIKLLQWLSKRDRDEIGPIYFTKGIIHFLKACLMFFGRAWLKITELFRGVDSAATVYYRMLRWGKHSGLATIPNDTPNEYGNRLIQYFPSLKGEISMIVAAFNREFYGLMVVEKGSLTQLAMAQRHMRRLRHWPTRIRIWFHHSERRHDSIFKTSLD